eukprot:82651-Prymnesium_polylepis.1
MREVPAIGREAAAILGRRLPYEGLTSYTESGRSSPRWTQRMSTVSGDATLISLQRSTPSLSASKSWSDASLSGS